MKRICLGIAMGMAAAAAGNAGAYDAYNRLTFVGVVVNDACSSGVPLLGVAGGVGTCMTAGVTRAVYVEKTSMASGQTGIAMRDYFVARADGGRKLVVTRQYR